MLSLSLAAVPVAVLNVFKVVHILSAIYFGLGALLATIYSLQVPNTPTLIAKARVMQQGSRVALSMIIPGVLLAGITGILLTAWEGIPFSSRWVLSTIICYALALIIGAASGPITARTRRQTEVEARSGKRPSAELLQALRSPVPSVLTSITLALTVILVLLMFFKQNIPVLGH